MRYFLILTKRNEVENGWVVDSKYKVKKRFSLIKNNTSEFRNTIRNVIKEYHINVKRKGVITGGISLKEGLQILQLELETEMFSLFNKVK